MSNGLPVHIFVCLNSALAVLGNMPWLLVDDRDAPSRRRGKIRKITNIIGGFEKC